MGIFWSIYIRKRKFSIKFRKSTKIKNYFVNQDIFKTLNYIYDLHIQEGYKFFYFNLIPSFFGLYYFSIEKSF